MHVAFRCLGSETLSFTIILVIRDCERHVNPNCLLATVVLVSLKKTKFYISVKAQLVYGLMSKQLEKPQSKRKKKNWRNHSSFPL